MEFSKQSLFASLFSTLENACSQRAERKLAARTMDWIFSVPLLKQHFYCAFIREGGLLLR